MISSVQSLLASRHRLFYGWRMVIGAFFSQSMHSSLLFLSQGLYVVEFEAAFAWSRGAIAWAFGMLRIETGFLGPVQGIMIDRFGPRPVMRIGTLLFGGGLILMGQLNELWHLFVALSIIAMGTSMAGFLTVNTTIAHWFIRKRARAMSLTSHWLCFRCAPGSGGGVVHHHLWLARHGRDLRRGGNMRRASCRATLPVASGGHGAVSGRRQR